MGTFNDLIIELGFDSSKVQKGLNHLDKMIDKAGKRHSQITKKNAEDSATSVAKSHKKVLDEKTKAEKIHEKEKLKYARDFNKKQVQSENKVKKSAKDSAAVFKQIYEEKEKYARAFNNEQVQSENKVKKSAKDSAAVFKQMYEEKEKYASDFNKGQVQFENKVKKSAKDSAAVFKQMYEEKENLEKLEKQQKIEKSLKQDNLRLSKSLLAVSGKEVNINKELPLKKQNALLEKQIKLHQTRNMRADHQVLNIQSRSHFKNLPQREQEKLKPRFEQAKAEFKLTGDTRAFKILNEDLKVFKKNLGGLGVVQNGVTDSTRNMIRSYASLFALLEGSKSIENVGIEVQGMSVAMLSSSGSAKKASEDLSFINTLADKTGNDLKSMTDSYVKMQFALKNKIPDTQFKEFFTNTNKLFTSLKLTKEQAKLAGKALQQMANKNQVMSEELKGQLAESLPGAVQIFADALGVGTEKLFDMMQKGQVNFQKILPKLSKKFEEVAEKGGAYKAALKSLIVTKGRFGNEAFRAQNKIFRSGFEEGMSELYQTLTKELKTTGKSQEDLGNIYKNFLKIVSQGIRLAVPLIEALVQVTSKMTDAVSYSLEGWKILYKDIFLPLPNSIKLITLAIAGLSLAMKSVIARGVLLLSVFQEVASLFDDKLVGVLEAKLGSQFNLKTMQQTKIVEKDGKYFSEGKPINMLDTIEGKGVAVAGTAASVAATVYVIKKLVAGFKVLTSAATGFARRINAAAQSIQPAGQGGKSKSKGSKSKNLFSKSTMFAGALGAASVAAPAAALTTLAAPVAYSLLGTDENKGAILDQVMSGGLGSREQRALQRAEMAWQNNPANLANQVNTQAQMQSPRTNYVTLSPEINVNIEGSDMVTEDAGMKIATTTIETLESQLSAVMRRGRN